VKYKVYKIRINSSYSVKSHLLKEYVSPAETNKTYILFPAVPSEILRFSWFTEDVGAVCSW